MTRKALPQHASFCARKESLAGRPLARFWQVRCVTVGNKQNRKRVVTLVPDTGNKYLSKMYNNFWMAEQGFIHRQPHGDLSDLISHRYEAGEVITVGPDDSLLTAFKRMRDSDVSQLPVVDKSGRAIGLIDESDLLVKVHREPSHFNDPEQGDDGPVGNVTAGCKNYRLAWRIRSRPGRYRDGRQQISWANYAHRLAFVSPRYAEIVRAAGTRVCLT